jgi:hypothetical protein
MPCVACVCLAATFIVHERAMPTFIVLIKFGALVDDNPLFG